MRSMRGGFRSVVGQGSAAGPANAGSKGSKRSNGSKTGSKKSSLFWNVLTVALVIAAALLLASRLGVF